MSEISRPYFTPEGYLLHGTSKAYFDRPAGLSSAERFQTLQDTQDSYDLAELSGLTQADIAEVEIQSIPHLYRGTYLETLVTGRLITPAEANSLLRKI